jgi:UDP-3-O-acyl N-acetylglucosamine deacetylase
MVRARQTTLSAPVTIESPTLFTDQRCACTIAPAPADSGVILEYDGDRAEAHIENLSDEPAHDAFRAMKPRCSAIRVGSASVFTVEHLLSALTGLGIDNAIVSLSTNELPIFDGSSRAFADALRGASIIELNEPTRPVRVRAPIRVGDDGAWITIEPSEHPSYEYTIDYGPGSPVARATVSWGSDPDDYIERVAPARTFSLEHEVSAMRELGLFTHLSARDMLVLGDGGPIDNELNHEHECALHKLLDLIGDLRLAGSPLIARVRAHRSGHALAHRSARAIIEQQ